MKISNKNLLYGLIGYVKPYKLTVLLSFCSMLIVALLEPLVPALLTPLIDENLINKSFTNAWNIPVLLMLVFIGKGIAEYVANVSSQWIANKAISEIRQDVFEHQISLPVEMIQKESHGRITSRFLYDIPQVSASISNAWIILIRDSLVLLALTSYLFYLSWVLATIMVLVSPPIAFLINRVGKKMRASNVAIQEATGDLAKVINQSVQGISEIKLYNNQPVQNLGFRKISEKIRKKTMYIIKLSAANVPTVQVLSALAVTVVIYVATILSKQDQLSPGQFVSFIAAMSLLFEPIRRLTSVNSIIQKGLAAARSIFELLNLDIEENQNVRNKIKKIKTSSSENDEHQIVFDDVSFKYLGQKEYALRNVSFYIEKNEYLGIAGVSGSGKTTILNLLASFYKPAEGAIFIDSKPIQSIPLISLRKYYSWVGQPVILFDGTVRENLLVGDPKASEEDIIRALKQSYSYEFVFALKAGLDTNIGPNGSFLSGGQCQRIAIARALIKKSPIFLFDEATSALDLHSEKYIQDSIKKIKAKRTIITIAHRISTLASCDRILVFDSGKLCQVGNHKELINKEGKYKSLINAKSSGGFS